MKKPKWVLWFIALSVIFFSIIQSQNSRANENESDHLLRKMRKHEVAAGIHFSLARQHTAQINVCLLALSSLGSILKIQDCTDEFLSSTPVGTKVSTNVRDKNEQTRVGAIFRRVKLQKFKIAWRQISADGKTKGVIWSEQIGSFTNDNRDGKTSQAKKACEDRGGRLPSIGELKNLMAGFDLGANGLLSKKGRSEFHRLFPDMKDRWFWLSSTSTNDPDNYAWVFSGDSGDIRPFGYRNNPDYSVLCVSGPSR